MYTTFVPYILDWTFFMSTLLKIFPEADLGMLFTKVTARNLLYGATYIRQKEGKKKNQSLKNEKCKRYYKFYHIMLMKCE